MKVSPYPKHFIAEGDQIKFGNSKLDIIFTPGHGSWTYLFIK